MNSFLFGLHDRNREWCEYLPALKKLIMQQKLVQVNSNNLDLDRRGLIGDSTYVDSRRIQWFDWFSGKTCTESVFDSRQRHASMNNPRWNSMAQFAIHSPDCSGCYIRSIWWHNLNQKNISMQLVHNIDGHKSSKFKNENSNSTVHTYARPNNNIKRNYTYSNTSNLKPNM